MITQIQIFSKLFDHNTRAIGLTCQNIILSDD